MSVTIHPFLEPSSGSYTFVVVSCQSRTCAIIDPALGVADCDGETHLNTDIADSIVDWIKAQHFVVRWILETHVHADRPSAAGYLKSRFLCAKTAIGAKTPNIEGYDVLLTEGEKICLGTDCGRVLETPGHTPGCVSYQFEDAVFVGDTLFMPDTGTARCDFPGGCAHQLYSSIQRILDLPESTRIYVCHDYGGDGRRYRFVTTVEEERQSNIHVGAKKCVDEFVRKRTERDRTLAAPRWSAFSIPANLRCAQLDEAQRMLGEVS